MTTELRVDALQDADVSEMQGKPSPLTLFAFEYPPCGGGISRLSGEIARYYEALGVQPTVITQEFSSVSSGAPLPTVRVPARRPLREWKAFLALRSLKSPAPVMCGLWYPEGLIAALANRRPLIILAHGAELMPTVETWRRGLWSRLQRWVLERADLVIANSKFTEEFVLKVAPKARVVAIPLGVDEQRFRPRLDSGARVKLGVEGKRVVTTVARLHAYKGHETVFQALRVLSDEERKDLVYLIAGTGPYESSLRTLATELGVESCVRWLGFLPEEDLPELYAATDLFVLCTRDSAVERGVEGFGLAFLEAQACGVPVVGTVTGGIPDAVRHGEGGWLIAEDDYSALSGILRTLAKDPAAFQAEGKRARNRVLREGTWQRYGNRLVQTIRGMNV
jgi:phosphatidylinositol alpha-1,6-mannosyltransferase